MLKSIFISALLLISAQITLVGQEGMVGSQAFDEELQRYLTFSVPVITVDQLSKDMGKYVILDARDNREYETSHLQGAIFIGYEKPLFDQLDNLDKAQPILLYCSIGYRSEKIGEELKVRGFTRVYNLYGSIFEWVNQGLPVFDQEGNEVHRVHTFDKSWSKWVSNGDIQKIW